MALTNQEISDIQKRIEHAARPLVFFDDDADGLASYLLVRHHNVNAIPLRAAMGPELKLIFKRYVVEHHPDLILILDKPRVEKEFFDHVQTPTIWLDHHDPEIQQPATWSYPQLTYYNPALHDNQDNRPVSYWMRQITNGPLWLAAVGATSDWYDGLLDELRENNPEIAPENNNIHQALFESKLGEIIRIFNFSLKGRTSQINKNIRELQRIRSPTELLEATTQAAKHIRKHTKPLREEYQTQLQEALTHDTSTHVYVHIYENIDQSFVADIANELLMRTEAEIILVARRDSQRMNISIRSHHTNLPPILEQALEETQGYGGGHENACGASIESRDWQNFLSVFQEYDKQQP